MTVLLELRPGDGRAIPPPAVPPACDGDGRGGAPRPDPLPLWLALTVVVLLAIGLTYVGMLTQIWANLSGAQLPGA